MKEMFGDITWKTSWIYWLVFGEENRLLQHTFQNKRTPLSFFIGNGISRLQEHSNKSAHQQFHTEEDDSTDPELQSQDVSPIASDQENPKDSISYVHEAHEPVELKNTNSTIAKSNSGLPTTQFDTQSSFFPGIQDKRLFSSLIFWRILTVSIPLWLQTFYRHNLLLKVASQLLTGTRVFPSSSQSLQRTSKSKHGDIWLEFFAVQRTW